MKLKKLTAAVLAVQMLMSVSVFAEKSDEYKYFEKITNFASNTYIDDTYTQDDVLKLGIDGYLKEHPEALVEMLKYSFEGLDEYSEFFTAEEYASYLNLLNKAFYGIGVVISKKDGYVQITKCQEGGGAEAAGIKANDRIIRVNDVDVVGKSTSEVKEAISGALNTTVKITVLRGDEVLSFNVVRGEVREDTAKHTILEGDVAYIQITNFATTTDAEFEEILKDLDAKNIKKIILDLRNNPGGYLSAAVNIAGMLVPEGVIIKTEYRQEEKNATYMSLLKQPKYELEVLVNGNTASSSEILSSAIQDSGVGKLIGETTYGKAVIQDMYRLENGMAAKLTVGRYLTRNGKEINKVGLEPDVEVLNEKRLVDMSQYTQFDYKSAWSVGMSGDSVKAAQERLYGMGYQPGNLDGEFTEDTEEAIKAFQKAMGLYEYGVLDITTQVRLENEFCVMEEIIDKQLMKAYELFGGNADHLYQ